MGWFAVLRGSDEARLSCRMGTLYVFTLMGLLAKLVSDIRIHGSIRAFTFGGQK